MRFHPIALVGVLLVAGGVATLIWPQMAMPARKQEVQIGEGKAIISTRRIVTFPRPFGVLLILAGLGQVFFTSRQPVKL
ncbi:MAG TPA: hypothetical protein VGD60_10625 [Candidatus Acidoferrales bacterium]